MRTETLSDHGDFACRKLWCAVVEDATIAARDRRCETSRRWFKSDIWRYISKCLFDAHTIAMYEQEALFGKPVIERPVMPQTDVPQARQYTKQNWSDNPRAIAARNRYRQKQANGRRVVPTSSGWASGPGALNAHQVGV
jgi:hypothetical protein